jgi:GH18 family chitinase
MIGLISFLLATATGASTPWVDGYYMAASQAQDLPVNEIDFGPLTHLVYFSLIPTATGGLDMTAGGLTEAGVKEIVDATHGHNKKILICIGGANSGPAYEKAISSGTRSAFVAAIVDWVATHGFDGADVDMEPVTTADIPNFQPFIQELKKALLDRNPDLILTTAVNQAEKAAYLNLQDSFDQINIMTYDLSGLWEGYETWYNSNLFNGGRNFKSNGKPLPSVATIVQDWTSAGFAKDKLGIGAAFYAGVWHGAAGPNQNIQGVTFENITYDDVMSKYYAPAVYHWDLGAHSPYLSLPGKTAAENLFISYDDERLCKEKVRYVRSNALGGMIIWQLAGGYRPSLPPGSRNPLLGAIGYALTAPFK